MGRRFVVLIAEELAKESGGCLVRGAVAASDDVTAFLVVGRLRGREPPIGALVPRPPRRPSPPPQPDWILITNPENPRVASLALNGQVLSLTN